MIDAELRPRQLQNDTVDLRDLGDEFLVYDRASKQVHVLNSTAREIYRACDGTRTLTEIGAAIARDYEIDAGTALRDLLVTVQRLGDLGLLELE